jgi:hypothetical protein
LLQEWIEKFTKSAYLRHLEAEVVRLREENRQLVNSLLASHGMQQLEGIRSTQTFMPIKRPNWIDWRRKAERQSAHPIAPVQPAPGKTTPDA